MRAAKRKGTDYVYTFTLGIFRSGSSSQGSLLSKITLWRTIVVLILAAGCYGAYARFALGLHDSTHLTDGQPWGLWVGLGTLCGVGISAGGFAIAAAVYLLGFERYRPIVRVSVLLSFLGYLTVVIGMMYELGLPWRIWHPIVMWNRHSVLFEVSWCVMLYTTVLSLEFSPALIEVIPWKAFREFYLKWHHEILIGLVMVGAVLSSLHQSFLGGLYLLAKGKLDPLWYSQYLPTLFYLSAVPAGLAATIMVAYLCTRSMNARIDPIILTEMSQVIAPLLYVYALFRGIDLFTHGGAAYILQWRQEVAPLLPGDRIVRGGAHHSPQPGEDSHQPAASLPDMFAHCHGLHDQPSECLRDRV